MNGIDATDRTILSLLQENARISNAEVGRRIGLATSAVHQRIRKLEERGIILGYAARVDPRSAGYGLAAFVMIQTGEGARSDRITEWLRAVPEVLEVHRVVGEDCFFVKVRVPGPDDLAELLDNRIQRIPGVASTRTTIVLQTGKESTALPLDAGADSAGTDDSGMLEPAAPAHS
jgi:Lrp/AsnC family transcriptional regulator, leucine-responsive regulatory protein